MNLQFKNSLLLLLASVIWGTAFVAQSVGMDHIGPLTFTAARSFLGAAALYLFIPFLDRIRRRRKGAIENEQNGWSNRTVWVGGLVCGLFLFCGSSLQQYGLLYTSVGKVGFITSLYIVFVPLVGFFIGRAPALLARIAVPIALIGLYFLCFNKEAMRFELGDMLVFLCAIAFTGHILVIDRFTQNVDAVRMSCIQFIVCGILATLSAVPMETLTAEALLKAIGPLLYAGILSSAVAFTLQIVAQRGLNPTLASLIMSLESVVSVLAGWIILSQTLSEREILGCLLMAIAIVFAQLPANFFKRLAHLRHPHNTIHEEREEIPNTPKK